MRFTVEVPSDEQLEELYNRLYSEGEVYQRHLNEVRQLQSGKGGRAGVYRTKAFLKPYGPRLGDRMLEVGCGVGTFLIHAKARGWQVEGIDLSESAIRASKDIHGLSVRAGSFEDLDFDEAAYSAIVTWEVLEHLADAKGFLEKARRLLKPDGVIACSVPNEGEKVPYPDVLGPASLPPIHLNFWDAGSLHRFFDLNGFATERVITQRTMVSLADPRSEPLRFLRLQAGALVGAYEGQHLFASARPRA